MKRFSRRLVGALIGLALGWWLAGVWGDYWAGVHTLHAENAPGQTHAAEQAHEEQHEAHADPNFVPGEGQTDWYRSVVLAAAGLFIAAVLIGLPVSRLRREAPPEPAPSHDAHGHH